MLIFVAYSVLGNLKSYGATRKSSNPPNMLILAAFSVLWSVSDCGVIMTVESSQRNDGKDWSKSVPTREEFDGHRLILKPVDRDRISVKRFDWNWLTVEPFDWEDFTEKPFDWDQFTVNPNDWDNFKPTPRDDYFYKHHKYDTASKMIFFLPVVGLIFFVAVCCFCKYAVCNGKSRTNTPSPTLHPPPRIIIPPNRSEQSPPNPTAPSTNSVTTNDSSGRFNSNDRPPDYSEVVWSDFRVGQNQYPGVKVKPTIPETPPPNYDAESAMRY